MNVLYFILQLLLIVGILWFAFIVIDIAHTAFTRHTSSITTFSKKSTYSKDSNILIRSTEAFDRVQNGEIKREILINEADPYNSDESIASFKNTLSSPQLVKLISSIKEVRYHEQN